MIFVFITIVVCDALTFFTNNAKNDLTIIVAFSTSNQNFTNFVFNVLFFFEID